MRLTYLLIALILTAGIFALPNILARMAGSHTAEFNHTGVMALNCLPCHSYIYDELNATQASRLVLQKHRNAAGNASYASGWLHPNVTNTTDYGVCQMCHVAKTPSSTAHTQIIVRVCTDLNCHGNNATTNNTAYRDAGRAGPNLGSPNAHEAWFDLFSGQLASYQNESGSNYTKGYWTCVGCHTHAEVSLNLGETVFAHNNASAFENTSKRYT